MALGFMILGIIVGTVAAVMAFATGAGSPTAFLCYVGGGMAGLAGGVLVAFLPRQGLLTALPRTE